MKLKIHLLLLIGLVPVLLVAQDYDHLWEEYLRLDRQLQEARHQEEAYTNRRTLLLEKQNRLRQHQTWLNGWIVQLQLSGISQSLVRNADSLESFRKRIAVISDKHTAVFHDFKIAYQARLAEPGAKADTSSLGNDRAVLLARSLINNESSAALLPDYTTIMNELYEDPHMRRLVYADLSSVLEQKIALIDSLVQDRNMDLALLRRLRSFHRDLWLQEESNADFEGGSEAGPSQTSSPNQDDAEWYAKSGISNYTTTEPDVEGMAQSEEVSGSLENRQPETGGTGSGGEDSILRDIERLQLKRVSYLHLLHTIEEELSH